MAAKKGKLCTFAETGENYKVQDWYECNTCGLSGGSGCCVVCAQQCHRGHNLSAPKNSRFFCDCGSGSNCKSMGNAGSAQSAPTPAPGPARPATVVQPTPAVQKTVAQATAYRPKDLPQDPNETVIRLPPFYFVHILDSNRNVTKVLTGPQTITRMDHESVVLGPREMIAVPPASYCVIADPVQRDAAKAPLVDKKNGQYLVRFGEKEVRLAQEPFPLYPGESVAVGVSKLQVVPDMAALRLRAAQDHTDAAGQTRRAGEEWLFRGPATYIPQIVEEVVEMQTAVMVAPTQALRIRARFETKDHTGSVRKAGEEWLVREAGAYLADVNELVVGLVDAITLNEVEALHLRAARTFNDSRGVERKAGQEWLITYKDEQQHIPDVYEEVLGVEKMTILNNRQYCIVLDPVDKNGVPQLGQREMRRGDLTFFLQPGERLQGGIQSVYVLTAEEALLVKATERFSDRMPGDRWLVTGPAEYFPPVQVEILNRHTKIALDMNEGIYVRDTRTGAVRMVIGESYLLKEYEERWSKELPDGVKQLLGEERGEEWSVVKYRVPHNAAVQIYDYRNKRSRVVFGPELVLLGPDEQFTQLSLSGGKPKKSGQIRDLKLQLGPDFSTDIVVVETADHARLQLKLSYNWHFEVDKTDQASAALLFQVPDFVGDFCKAIASRVRGAVAAVPFDQFHKNSAGVINTAVFGTDAQGNLLPNLPFPANGLVVDAVDIQSVEPVDQRTRDALQKSVQMAIEITTNSQEASANHEANRTEQESKGRLERQKITDAAKIEQSRRSLLALQAKCAAVTSTGQATAEARARAEAAQIEGEAAVLQAELKATAASIESSAELNRVTAHQSAELGHQRALNALEIERAQQLSLIQTQKFKKTVDSIGADTIMKMAQAGPETQAKLLGSLGLQGYLVTDGNSPINLFNTANGLVGGGAGAAQ